MHTMMSLIYLNSYLWCFVGCRNIFGSLECGWGSSITSSCVMWCVFV